MTERANALMRAICVELGFRENPNFEDFLSVSEPITADAFALQILRAEPIDATTPSNAVLAHVDALRAAFILHMGGAIVDASEFS